MENQETQLVQRKITERIYYYLGTKVLTSKKEERKGEKFGVLDLYSLIKFDDGTMTYSLENPFIEEKVSNMINSKGIRPFSRVTLVFDEITNLNAKPKVIDVNLVN